MTDLQAAQEAEAMPAGRRTSPRTGTARTRRPTASADTAATRPGAGPQIVHPTTAARGTSRRTRWIR